MFDCSDTFQQLEAFKLIRKSQIELEIGHVDNAINVLLSANNLSIESHLRVKILFSIGFMSKKIEEYSLLAFEEIKKNSNSNSCVDLFIEIANRLIDHLLLNNLYISIKNLLNSQIEYVLSLQSNQHFIIQFSSILLKILSFQIDKDIMDLVLRLFEIIQSSQLDRNLFIEHRLNIVKLMVINGENSEAATSLEHLEIEISGLITQDKHLNDLENQIEIIKYYNSLINVYTLQLILSYTLNEISSYNKILVKLESTVPFYSKYIENFANLDVLVHEKQSLDNLIFMFKEFQLFKIGKLIQLGNRSSSKCDKTLSNATSISTDFSCFSVMIEQQLCRIYIFSDLISVYPSKALKRLYKLFQNENYNLIRKQFSIVDKIIMIALSVYMNNTTEALNIINQISYIIKQCKITMANKDLNINLKSISVLIYSIIKSINSNQILPSLTYDNFISFQSQIECKSSYSWILICLMRILYGFHTNEIRLLNFYLNNTRESVN